MILFAVRICRAEILELADIGEVMNFFREEMLGRVHRKMKAYRKEESLVAYCQKFGLLNV